MPAAIKNGRLIKRCEICAQPAQHGYGVNLRSAMNAKDAGQIDKAKHYLGKWYCTQHKGMHGG